MAKGDLQSTARKRPEPSSKRVAQRAAQFCSGHALRPQCQERHDEQPKEVHQLNAGFFTLEAMRRANVAEKQRNKVRAKVRSR